MSKHCRLEKFTQVNVVLFAAATPGQNNLHARRGQSHPSATVLNPQNATSCRGEVASWDKIQKTTCPTMQTGPYYTASAMSHTYGMKPQGLRNAAMPQR
jgi:hypothetical protein